jgi:hypothetical protein
LVPWDVEKVLMAKYHFFVSVIFLIMFGFIWTPTLIIPFLLGAVLVDFDHQVDFFLRKKRFTLSVTELSETLAPYHHFILPFHSYEAIIFSILLMPISPMLIGAFVNGLIVHMLFDAISNGYPGAASFSLIYRIKNWRKEF